MGIWKSNFKLKELKLAWWLKKAETGWDKGRKGRRNENIKLYFKFLAFKGKILQLFHYALFLFHPFFKDMRHIEDKF